jgi:hypothetical protein
VGDVRRSRVAGPAPAAPLAASLELRKATLLPGVATVLDRSTSISIQSVKLYVGVIWPDHDKPGVRVRIEAENSTEAAAKLEAQYGEGHQYTLHNEEDAHKRR